MDLFYFGNLPLQIMYGSWSSLSSLDFTCKLRYSAKFVIFKRDFNIKEPAIISVMSSSATFSLLFMIFTKRFSVIRPLLVGSNDLRRGKKKLILENLSSKNTTTALELHWRALVLIKLISKNCKSSLYFLKSDTQQDLMST